MLEGASHDFEQQRSRVKASRLVLVALLCLLPVWIAAGIHAYMVQHQEYGSLAQQAENRARSVAAALDHELFGVQTALYALATSPAFETGDVAAIHRQAVKLTKYFPGSDVIVAERSGQQIVNSYRSFGARLPQRATPETVERVFRDGVSVVSELYFGAVTRRPLASIDVPVTIGGVVRYDLAMTFPVDRLSNLLSEQFLSADWVGMILDGAGTIVARNIDPARFVGQSAPSDLRSVVGDGQAGRFDYISSDGLPELAAFRKSDRSNWSVVVSVPRSVIWDKTKREIAATFAAPALCTVAALLMILFLTRPLFGAASDPVPMRQDLADFVERSQDFLNRRQVETELKRLSEIVETVGDQMAFIDSDFRYQFVNSSYANMFLTTPQAMLGRPVESVVGKSIFERALARLRAALSGEPQRQVMERRFPDGRVRIFDAEYRPFRSGDVITGVVVRLQDITERIAIERELRVAAVAFETQEGIAITDAKGRLVRVNKAFTAITGYSLEEVVGQRPAMLFGKMADSDFDGHFQEHMERDGYWTGEIWNFRKSGEEYPLWLNLTAVIDADGRHSHYVVVFQDITERKENEERMRNLAFYDTLTGLPNRFLIQERLRQARISCERNGRCAALMFIDLDNFKSLNDTHGHDAGDRLLIEVSRRLEHCVRQMDTVGRLGGDEFIVLLENIGADPQSGERHAIQVANKVMDLLCRTYDLGGFDFISTPSIGLTLFCDASVSAEELLRRADQAMYQAKSAGRKTIRLHTVDGDAPEVEDADWS